MHWAVMNVKTDKITCFESFCIEHAPKEIKKFIGNKNMISNIYRIQTHDSIICQYFWTGFTDFMLKKSFIDFTSLF